MVYMKTYIFNHFYQRYLVLLTMVPRNSVKPVLILKGTEWYHILYCCIGHALFTSAYHAVRADMLSPLGLEVMCRARYLCLERFRTAVPFWGQTTQIRGSLSPKRDCGPNRVLRSKGKGDDCGIGHAAQPGWAAEVRSI